MARLFTSAIILLVWTQFSWSQLRVITPKIESTSSWGAASASLLLPGLGQSMLGLDREAQWFYLGEASFWVVLGGSYYSKEHYLSSAVNYAGRHAGATHAPRDEIFLQLIGEFQSRSGSAGVNASPDLGEDYNQDLIRQGQDVDKFYPNTPEYYWDWGTSANSQNNQRRSNYNTLLNKYRYSKIVFQTSVGLLVLNRVVSSIHAMRKGKSNSKVSPQSNFYLQYRPDLNNGYQVVWTKGC